jgi:hypothetical protein
VVGTSTLLTDNQLIDDRLDLDLLPEREGAALSALDPIILFPDREAIASFPVDTSVSVGQVVQIVSGSPGSVFGSASVGAEYVLEFFDGSGSLNAATNGADTYNSSFGDLQWVVNSGSAAFLAGDVISFDVFPMSGDVLLRADEQPLFLRDVDGAALDLVTNIKTSV